MIDSSIILVKPAEREQDATGAWRTTATKTREVPAQVESVSRNEFFSGGQAGFRPEYQVTVFQAEYRGELMAIYNGLAYAIYRTYHVPGTDYMELYLQREVGVHNG